MKTFTVKTRFIFEGVFEVRADNTAEARLMVEEGCGLTLGSDIHTYHGDDEVTDWDFGMHPEKQVVSVKRKK